MIALMLHINLLNLSWLIKCLFLRNIEPLNFLPFVITDHLTPSIKHGITSTCMYTHKARISVQIYVPTGIFFYFLEVCLKSADRLRVAVLSDLRREGLDWVY